MSDLSAEEQAAALGDLNWQWEGAYRISVTGGEWRAIRLDDGTQIITADPVALHEEILRNYHEKPVPRGDDG